MRHLLPVLEILRDSALRLGGADEVFITATQGATTLPESFEPRRPAVKLEEVVVN